MWKYDKSGYVAGIEEPAAEIEVSGAVIEVSGGEIGAPSTVIEEPTAEIDMNIEINVEPPAKRFCQGLRSRINQKSEKSTRDENSYCADDEYALESTAWQNVSSD